MPVADPGGIKPKRKMPEGLWAKCPACSEIILRKTLGANHWICTKCGTALRMRARERIAMLVEPDSFIQIAKGLRAAAPLGFTDTEAYPVRLEAAHRKTRLDDAMLAGEATIGAHRVVIGAMAFEFMGGSMGSVVGEVIARAAERAVKTRSPLILISASGGARMQEGILSLMQMAKTAAALARLSARGLPCINILADPTAGGVTASFAMLGDVIIAEPGALIGFAGPRVIEQTIGQKLPAGFQKSEYLLQHGMVDMICERKSLKTVLIRLLDWLDG